MHNSRIACVSHYFTGRRARILIAVAWVLSAIFSTPMLVLYEEGVVQDQVQCWIDLPAPWQWQLYLTLVAVSLLVLPACLIFACYVIIVRTIWVQSAALTASAPNNHRSNNNNGTLSAPPCNETIDSERANSGALSLAVA